MTYIDRSYYTPSKLKSRAIKRKQTGDIKSLHSLVTKRHAISLRKRLINNGYSCGKIWKSSDGWHFYAYN